MILFYTNSIKDNVAELPPEEALHCLITLRKKVGDKIEFDIINSPEDLNIDQVIYHDYLYQINYIHSGLGMQEGYVVLAITKVDSCWNEKPFLKEALNLSLGGLNWSVRAKRVIQY